MSDNQNVKDRLKSYIDYVGISVRQFERECGLCNAYVNSIRQSIQPDTLMKIVGRYPTLNISWLMTGEGTMLRTDATAGSVEEAEAKHTDKDIVMVPVLNLDARGGFADNTVVDTSEYITELIPFRTGVARQGDFVIPMYGDSMYPRYPSGSRLLVRQIEGWREYLEFGACYVIELTDSRRIVKIIKKGSDKEHFLLVSVNPDFEAQEIPLNIINNVFLVKLMLKNEIL